MSKPATVSAVIVTWNSEKDISRALTSLLNQSIRPDPIIVVDNGSTDSTVQIVRWDFPQVKLIPNERNLGFAAGNNIGIKAAGGEWIVLLNPDASLESDWIQNLLEFGADNRSAGSLGGVLFRIGDEGSEPEIVDSIGIEIYESRRVRDGGAGEGLAVVPSNPERVFGVCAAAVMLRREMLDQVADGDEVFPARFFCYYEDADLAWRGWRAGWEAWIVPAAHGFHRRGGSPVGSRFSRYLTHRNRLWMILRNDRISDVIPFIPQLLLHKCYLLARVLIYPYLLRAGWESVLGIGLSMKERRRLAGLGYRRPPFEKGVGFSSKERAAALKNARKNF
jgi:GT2 family glycosyltransferase